MKRPPDQSLAPPCAASALFFALSALLLRYPGIQDDEVLFTTPLYSQVGREFRMRIFHQDVFLMVMSYIGALKTILFRPIFGLFGTSPWTLRLPVALIGSATVLIFYFLARKSAGRWAALFAALLLATDPVFLLTNTVDWGPVALEHLLLVTAVWSLARFAENPGTIPEQKWLVLGFASLGLALWNKAIFVWALSGLVIAALAVFPGVLRRCATRRNLKVAATAFLVGALPLLVYNLRHKNATLGENAHLDTHGVLTKWVQLKNALNGTSLFVYMVSEEWMPRPKPAPTAVGRTAGWLRDHWGEQRHTGFYYVLGLLILAIPLWWRSRAARFSLLFTGVAWLAMALTRDAGGSAHHVILLWPFPVLFAAIALSRLAQLGAGKWLASAIAFGLIAMNLVVLNQYVVQFERDGPAETFTDAIYPLSDNLSAYATRPIYIVDWGVLNVLEFLHQGHLNLLAANEPLMTDAPPEAQVKMLHAMLANPSGVFVSHITPEEMFPLVNERLDRFAAASGYKKELLATIPDSNGRPRFEIFHFR